MNACDSSSESTLIASTSPRVDSSSVRVKSVIGAKASDVSMRATTTQSRPSMLAGPYAVMLSLPMYWDEVIVPDWPASARRTGSWSTFCRIALSPTATIRSASAAVVPLSMTLCA